MPNATEPVIYVLDFNVGNETEDPVNPYCEGRIAIRTPSSGKLKTLIPHEKRPDGIEVYRHGENASRIFWTQMGIPRSNDGIVQSSNLDGTDVKDVFAEGDIHTPKQLCFDEVNQKLYVCDREGLRVHRSSLDGTEKEVLVKTGDWTNDDHMSDSQLWCVGVCVDTSRGYFYWTQKGPCKGGKGKILRASTQMPIGDTASTRMDIEVVFNDLPEPIDLQIDPEQLLLYWTDRGDFPKGNTLNRAHVAGSFSEIRGRGYQILGRHLHEAIGLQVDKKNKHIYVSDMGSDVYQSDMDGENTVKLFGGGGVFTGIALAHLNAEEKSKLYGL